MAEFEELKELAAEMLAEERLKGRTKQGIATVKYSLPRLYEYLATCGCDFKALGYREAQGYLSWLAQTGRLKDGKPYANKSIQLRITGARTLFEFLKRRGLILANPFNEIERPKEIKSLPKNILSEEAMHKLLSLLACFWENRKSLHEQKHKYMAHVIAELQYATGLRINEVTELDVEAIDFKTGLINVKQGKGGKSRIAFLNDYAKEVLRLYVERMRPLIFERRLSGKLFCLSKDRLIWIVNGTLKEAAGELKQKVLTSHSFRHSLGLHLLRSGCDIRYIQEFLGHKKLRTTEIYTRVEKEDLKRVVDRFHPRKWGKKEYEAR